MRWWVILAILGAFLCGMLLGRMNAGMNMRKSSHFRKDDPLPLPNEKKDSPPTQGDSAATKPAEKSEPVVAQPKEQPAVTESLPPVVDELAREIKNSLVNPSKMEYHLKYPGPYWSQNGQEKVVDEWLNGLEKGFFIEAGAWTGEDLSNSLYLEKTRNWNGLLVEGNPHLFKEVESKNRKCYAIHAGLSIIKDQREKTTMKYKLAGPLGGYIDTYDPSHLHRANNEIAQKLPQMDGIQGSGDVVEVPVYPLDRILWEINQRLGSDISQFKHIAPNAIMVVDFFSLDTEGSEPKILEAIDFDKILFGLITVETNAVKVNSDRITAFLTEKKYKLIQDVGQDLWFGSPGYFEVRKLKWPEPKK